MTTMARWGLLTGILFFGGPAGQAAEAPARSVALLPPNARLAIIGDAITITLVYSRVIEAYLLACAGRTDLSIFNYGGQGDSAYSFTRRMESDLAVFKPTVATTCFGQVDGGYRPFEDGIGRDYERAMRVLLTKMAAMGVKTVVGSPGAVDTKYFQRNPQFFAGKSPGVCYNENLRKLRDIDEKLAAEFKVPFADVLTPMQEAMARAKAALGEDYDVGGKDIYPEANGGLVMAYAFLKALGCDGRVAEITVDMNGKATASDGHKVLESGAGQVVLESSRYPFIFDADPKSSRSTGSILPFVPFRQELNRFTLKTLNLTCAQAAVAWGTETKTFTRAQLEAGIDLPAEFARTPFDAEFPKLLKNVESKQEFEIQMIREVISRLGDQFKDDAELMNAQMVIRNRLLAQQSKMEQDLHASLAPIKHTLVITPLP